MLKLHSTKASTFSLILFCLLGLVLIPVTIWMRLMQAFGGRMLWVNDAGEVHNSLDSGMILHSIRDSSIQWWAVAALFTTAPFLIWMWWYPFKELKSRLLKKCTD